MKRLAHTIANKNIDISNEANMAKILDIDPTTFIIIFIWNQSDISSI